VNASRPRRFGLLSKGAAFVAGLAAASLVLTGCLYALIPDAEPRPTTSRTPDTSGVSAELLPFYGQTLEWEDCNGFDCTTVTAPLNWADPAAGEIELSVIRSRAEGRAEPVGSLLTNPGGPGASGVALIRDSLTFAVGDKVRERFDVIGFDPRGVGESTAVHCYDAADMDAYLFGIPQDERGSEAWSAELLEAHRAFAQACEANSGGILPYITTENAARDMDLLRAVLGDRELNYLGYSYGTFLGATYAKLFPDRVGRLVLDGAIDPSVSGLEVGTTQGVGFEDLSTLLASVDRTPIRGADGRMLGADALMTAIIAALYSPDSWSYLTSALDDAMAGDAQTAFLLADFYYNREGGQYLDNSTEAFRAYNCMDYPVDTAPEDEAAAQALLDAEAPTVAPYWGGPDPCEAWPYPPTGVREPITAEGAAPIVVVGTTNDPATPYEWSVSLADQLSSGVLITRVGEGHTGYNKGSACVDGAVEAYLIDGTVPEDGLRCE
jgi:pimeloyl-ACP methyl ester carboxylesterase